MQDVSFDSPILMKSCLVFGVNDEVYQMFEFLLLLFETLVPSDKLIATQLQKPTKLEYYCTFLECAHNSNIDQWNFQEPIK